MSLALLSGCASNGQRIDRAALSAKLSRHVVQGLDYRHVVYANALADRGSGAALLVFLEGDGLPWTDAGRRPAEDPTTANPVALRMLALSQQPGIYVSRPCYQEMLDAKCSSELWTGGRYSRAVVESLAAAIGRVVEETGADGIVLVGHSGGGTLAVLVGERLERVTAVVTIAANLDVDAWTRDHGYLPLTSSLNPAKSELSHAWPELHLSGAQDNVVPSATTAEYFTRYPQARRWTFSDFGHVCCWVEEWPQIESEILLELGNL